MQTSHCSVIINRLSGSYSPEKAAAVKTFLQEGGLSPQLYFMEDMAEATDISRQICDREHNPLIIICGGDGTINAVINGIVPGSATLAALPFGTSNVLTRELAISSMDDALHRILRGTSRSATVGLVEKNSLRKYFLLMVGIGLDGFVVQGVNFREKKLLGKGAYLLSAIRQLLHWEQGLMEVDTVNGKITCHSLIACNAARYGGNFKLAPLASLFTPEFEVVCIRNTTRMSYLGAAAQLLAGKGLQGTAFCRFRSSELFISGAKPVQVDGDYLCRGPLKIRTVPDFFRLIV